MTATPLEIKISLMRKGKTISGMARKFAECLPVERRNLESLRKQFSMCINGEREYPHLRKFVADELCKTVEQLFVSKNRRKAA